MEIVERRTMMRTIFSKLKGYFQYRKNIVRLKIRANVHCRIKRTSLAVKGLRDYKKYQVGMRKKIGICKKKYEGLLKDKAMTGFVKSLLRKNKKKKENIKALAFSKYTILYRSLICWKNYGNALEHQEKLKVLIIQHNEKRVQKYLIHVLALSTRISKIISRKKELYKKLIK